MKREYVKVRELLPEYPYEKITFLEFAGRALETMAMAKTKKEIGRELEQIATEMIDDEEDKKYMVESPGLRVSYDDGTCILIQEVPAYEIVEERRPTFSGRRNDLSYMHGYVAFCVDREGRCSGAYKWFNRYGSLDSLAEFQDGARIRKFGFEKGYVKKSMDDSLAESDIDFIRQNAPEIII